jgi:hypothetical protein
MPQSGRRPQHQKRTGQRRSNAAITSFSARLGLRGNPRDNIAKRAELARGALLWHPPIGQSGSRVTANCRVVSEREIAQCAAMINAGS